MRQHAQRRLQQQRPKPLQSPRPLLLRRPHRLFPRSSLNRARLCLSLARPRPSSRPPHRPLLQSPQREPLSRRRPRRPPAPVLRSRSCLQRWWSSRLLRQRLQNRLRVNHPSRTQRLRRQRRRQHLLHLLQRPLQRPRLLKRRLRSPLCRLRLLLWLRLPPFLPRQQLCCGRNPPLRPRRLPRLRRSLKSRPRWPNRFGAL